MKGETEETALVWSREKSEGRGEDGLWKCKRQLKKKALHFWLLQGEVRSLRNRKGDLAL